MVDTRPGLSAKPWTGCGSRERPAVADTIAEERSPSWPRAPHWKCGRWANCLEGSNPSRSAFPLIDKGYLRWIERETGIGANGVGVALPQRYPSPPRKGLRWVREVAAAPPVRPEAATYSDGAAGEPQLQRRLDARMARAGSGSTPVDAGRRVWQSLTLRANCTVSRLRRDGARGERPSPAAHCPTRCRRRRPNARETMARFLASWLEGRESGDPRPRSWKRYEEHIRLHLVPTLGRIPLARVCRRLTCARVSMHPSKRALELARTTVLGEIDHASPRRGAKSLLGVRKCWE